MNLNRCAIVIIGASGDLARRKLLPALDALFKAGKLGRDCLIVGSGRTHYTDEKFRQRFDVSDEFRKILFYHQYIPGLREFLASKGSFSKVVFFLAQPPLAYGPTARELAAEGFGREASIIIEKPFGYDFASARALNSELVSCFDESQIFRIDHYLAKEAVQNIMVFRFANQIFSSVWNSRYVESIQISALERARVDERGAYFDTAGIVRDMIQNHLLQLLCLVTMEAPVSLDPDDIRHQKVCVLRSLKVEEYRFHQYQGYCEEKGVSRSSETETFAELKLSINNLRWARTPVYIRSGKAVHRSGTEIGIRFHSLPKILFNKDGTIPPNQIIFKIQPAEGIIVDISTKEPGTDEQITQSYMNFCYRDSFQSASPEAYQRLLLDALRGDHTLFVSAAETEHAWLVLKDIINKDSQFTYTPGKLPESKLDVNWIDFDKYAHLCS